MVSKLPPLLDDAIQTAELIVGKPYIMEVLPSVRKATVKHYRLYGNPVVNRQLINHELLQRREYWNYWKIENISSSLMLESVPFYVVEEINDMFAEGVRLWPVREDMDYTYNYDIENWETSLGLT